MFILALLLLGYISFSKLGIDLFPEMQNPRIYVEVKSGEKPPEEMEKLFVKNIESLSIRQKDVLKVSSVSKVGVAQIIIEYTWDKDMDGAYLDIQKALASFAQNKEVDNINVSQYDPNTSPIMIVGLTHTSIDDMNELRKVAENYITNELVKLEGVAGVEISGKEENEVLISTNQYLLDAFGLSMAEIANKIESFNKNVSGGKIVENDTKYIIKGVSVFEQLNDLEHLIVGYKPVKANDQTAEKAPVFLKEVATVEFRNKEPENIVHINGKKSLALAIYKETKFNTVKAVEQVKEAMVTIQKALPGYEVKTIQNQGTFIKSAIDEVQESALLGIFLAVFVLFIFLKRFGVTLIVSIAIPISIVATFNLMYFNHLTLNIMTLGGLALGAGMLVDNAIVVMENIFRHYQNGESVMDSAIKGTSEVGGAITASTITTIVVFLPIVYLQGASGELFKDQAWTVAFSLVSSLAVAIFIIPMLFKLFFRKKYTNKDVTTRDNENKSTAYGSFLSSILNFKPFVVLSAIGLLFLSYLAYKSIGSEFMPNTSSNEFAINIKLQEGTKINRTESTIKEMEGMIDQMLEDNIETIYSQAGPSSDWVSSATKVYEGENTGFIKIKLKDDTKISTANAISLLRNFFKDSPYMKLNFSEETTALQTVMGTSEVAAIEVEVRGEELDKIEEILAQVKAKMAEMKELSNIQNSIEGGAPEIEVVIDRYKAGIHNLTVASIVSQIQNTLSGQDAGNLESGGELKDIRIKLPDMSLKEFENIVIKSGTQVFRLSELASIKHGNSPKEILHTNQNRIGKIMADKTDEKSLEHIVADLKIKLSDINLPPNYKIDITGEEEKRQEAISNLSMALLLSIILVYMVLASQFESLLHPFTILLTIPLAVVGAVFAFFILGQSFNIMAIIGIIMLVGIAVNDSIVLVDAINKLREKGLNRRDAIIKAGELRLRPIIMTSLTTMLALLPLCFGFGQSASLRSPMAIAVIGGLFTSTLLTLVVIPCVYDLIDRLKFQNYE